MDMNFNNPYSMDETEEEKKRRQQLTQTNNDYWSKANKEAQEVIEERAENVDRYGIKVPDYVYEELNKQIAYSQNPEETAHKYGLAFKYSQMFNTSFSDAYENIDNYNAALYGADTKKTYKEWYKAVSDALVIGTNGIRIGRIGNELMEADKNNDTEKMEQLRNEYKSLQKLNATLQDSVPRKWTTEALKAGMQSAPYTSIAAGAGIFGNLIAGPVGGTVAAWAASSKLVAGQEYMEMLDNGIRPEIARPAALISGGVQGLVEAALGETVSWMATGGRMLGSKIIGKPLQDKLVDKIVNNLQKRIHYGPAGKIITKNIIRYLGDIPEEGAEEAIQSISSNTIQNIVAKKETKKRTAERLQAEEDQIALLQSVGEAITDEVFNELVKELQDREEFRDIPEKTLKEICKEAAEEYKGGVLGAITLGIPAFFGNNIADAKDYHTVRTLAQTVESPEMLKTELKNVTVQTRDGEKSLYDTVFNGYSEEEKDGLFSDAYETVRAQEAAKEKLDAKEYAELYDTDENYENIQTDEETGEQIKEPVFRTNEGRLYTQDKIISEENGITTGQFVAGDGSKAENNSYGHLDYEKKAENKTITITSFKLNKDRKEIREDMYDEFARQNPGWNIEWNPVSKKAQAMKQYLSDINPSGKNNGLNYYADQNAVNDVNTRKSVAAKVNENIPSIKAKGQTAEAVAIMESMAKGLQMSLSDFVNDYFAPELFGDIQEALAETQQQNPEMATKGFAGAQKWKQFGNDVKAVIYAGENADFSTWCHELAHVYQDLMTGELKENAEAAFNVKDGDWKHSTFTFKDGTAMSSAEAFAYGFQDWLKTGKAEKPEMQNLFQKFAQFVARSRNALKDHIDLNKDITDVYDQMLAGDDSLLRAAEMAVAEQDRAARIAENQSQQQIQQMEESNNQRDERTAADEAEEESELVIPEEKKETVEPTSQEEIDELDRDTIAEEIANLLQQNKSNDEIIQALLDKANDRNLTDGINYQTNEDKGPLCTPLMIERATNYIETDLFTDEEKDRIKKNLEKHKGTGWANLVYLAINARHDIQSLFNNEEIPADSLFYEYNCDGYRKICSEGKDAVYEYFWSRSSFIGEPAKPEFAVCGSFINCSPSEECAKWCYAVEGRSGMAMMILNRELINWCVEDDPVRTADYVSWQWAKSPFFRLGKLPLRLLDTGDMSQQWVTFVARLNSTEGEIVGPNYKVIEEGKPLTKTMEQNHKLNSMVKPLIMTSIFSKRPELLSQVDPTLNIIQLSVDRSNLELAEAYPELPLSVVYDGSQKMIDFIASQEDRFNKHKGVILPVVISKTYLTEEQIKKLPNWALKYCCPINAGWKFIGNYSCADCYLNGMGCNQGRGKAVMDGVRTYANLGQLPKGVIANERTEQYDTLITVLREEGAPDGLIFRTVAKLAASNVTLSTQNDRARLEGMREGYGRQNYGPDGIRQETSRDRGTGTSENQEQLRYQIIGELGATNLDRIEEVSTRMDNLKIAKEMQQAGKGPRTIKAATGWEQGLDNKWRYETEDIKPTENSISALVNEYRATIRDMENLLSTMYNNALKDPYYLRARRNATSEEKQIVKERRERRDRLLKGKNQLKDRLDVIQKRAAGYEGGIPLTEYLGEDNWLFEAYPNFKNTTFYYKNLKDGLFGSYSYARDAVEISRLITPEQQYSTFVHEIQHAIQRQEGFARGGNEKEFKTNPEELIQAQDKEVNQLQEELQAIWDKMDQELNISSWIRKSIDKTADPASGYSMEDHFNELEKLYATSQYKDEYDKKKKELEKSKDIFHKLSHYEASADLSNNPLNDFKKYFAGLDEYAQRSIEAYEHAFNNGDYEVASNIALGMTDQQKAALDTYNSIKTRWNEINTNGVWLSPYDAYSRLSGEVESRNVESRINMSLADRWNTLLKNTEDISRKDQILYYQAAVMGMEEEQAAMDQAYNEAVAAGDMTAAQQLVDQAIQNKLDYFHLLQDDAKEEGWKYHRGQAPKKITKMYAVFNVSADGFRAAYAGNKNPTPVGVWIDAQNLESYMSDLVTFKDGSFKEYITGDTGTSASELFSPEKLAEYGLKPSTRMLLKRGGKHGADVPNFAQMNTGVDENGNKVQNKTLYGSLPHNKLIFEIECGLDENGDLTEYVKEHGRMDSKGNEGLSEIGPNQFYFFKTNPNANGNWGIAGTFRIARLVPYEEIVQKTIEANDRIDAENKEIEAYNAQQSKKKDMKKLVSRMPLQAWQGGYHPEDFGLTVEKVDQMYKDAQKAKLSDPITYDDDGNIIPLTQRFNPAVSDIRYQADETSDKNRQYYEAVNAGDMETAQKLVNERAAMKDYSPEQDYLGTHHAPKAYVDKKDFTNIEALQELRDEGYPINLYGIAYGLSGVTGDYFNPVTGPRYFMYDDYEGRESLRALLPVINNMKEQIAKYGEVKDIPTIKAYRATPNTVKEGMLQSGGQWITFSRDYAVKHGKHSLDGHYKIIEEDVKATDVWFDWNDMREWGYDNGENNVYRATKNSRKLADPVTYDDNGNVIPLSQRFNYRSPDIRYQETEQVIIPIHKESEWKEFREDHTTEEVIAELERRAGLRKETEDAYKALFLNPAFTGLHTKEGDNERYIHANVKDPKQGKWQISYFDKFGPWGHFWFDDIEEIFRNGDMQMEPELVEVVWDERIKYDRPYYDALDARNYMEAERILKDYAAKKGYTGQLDVEVTDKTDILIPPTKRLFKGWMTQNDYDAIGRDYSLQFQTEEQLFNDAKQYDSWEKFMDAYTTDFDPAAFDDPEWHSQVPYGADDTWYRNVWNMAHGLNEEIPDDVSTDIYEGDTGPEAMDEDFARRMTQDPDAFDEFMQMAAYYNRIDFSDPEWAGTDPETMQKIADIKDLIDINLADYNWRAALNAVTTGTNVSGGLRKRILGEMTDPMKVRDFRNVYAAVMKASRYNVEEEDSIAYKLKQRLESNKDRYYDIVAPYETIENVSPERRKQIAREMDNRDLAAKIRSGDIQLNDDVDRYLRQLERQITQLKNKSKQLENEQNHEYKMLAKGERKYLLDLNKRLQEAKNMYDRRTGEIARKIEKGLKITDRYTRETDRIKSSYDELFRKLEDYKRTMEITAEVEALMKKQEDVVNIREELYDKQKERNLVAEVKKMRIQLVKRAMRRVPFDRIDYDSAKTVIAIQRMLEPNLMGGVNRWIGTEGPYLRGIVSSIITDTDYKEELLKYLINNSKASLAYANFLHNIENLKTMDDFNNWTKSDREYAIRHLPKENWIRDLKLQTLAKEREESIDLDIGTVKKERNMYDENGNIVKDYKGDPIKQVTFEVSYSDEIGQLVHDAVGDELFNLITNVPFADWTTQQLESLAQKINEIYTEGRDLLQAKKDLRANRAQSIRAQIQNAVMNTGIVINDDDPREVVEEKYRKINEALGLNDTGLAGTEAAKDTSFKAKINAMLHGYNDANVRRVARILDDNKEGINTIELYWRENEAYEDKMRRINSRIEKINYLMADYNITAQALAQEIEVNGTYIDFFTGPQDFNMKFTVDELLYFKAAAEDYEMNTDGTENQYAATSKNAVMFGNMLSTKADLKHKEDLQNGGQEEVFIQECRERFEAVIKEADRLLMQHPEYKVLLKAIQDDYEAQYERMNKVSIDEFNSPIHRVKAYVPLVRMESDGETNENQVKEDFLTVNGMGNVGVNKGMTMRRIKMKPFHQKPVQTGLYRTWVASIERTEHFIFYAPYVRELNRVYKSRDAVYVRQYIKARYGKGMIDYIDTYINELANPNAGKRIEAGSTLLHTLRGKTAPAYLAWKASAIIKQGLTSPWPYMQFITPAEYLSASFKIISSKGQIYDAITSKSIFMKNRVMDPMNDLIDEMAEYGKTKFDRIMGKQAQIGMKGLEWIDWVCVAPGWYACYLKEYANANKRYEVIRDAAIDRLREENMMNDVTTRNYMTEEQIKRKAEIIAAADVERQAVQFADDCTRLCQPSNRLTDISPLFKNSSEAMKAYLQFQTSLNVIWQNIRYDIPYAAKNKLFKRITGMIIGYVAAGIFMNSVMDGYDDKDDKEMGKLRKLIFYAITQFSDAVPMIGSELTNTLDKVITGKAQYSTSGTDMTPTATKIFSVLTQATQGNWTKAAELTADGIGMYLGLPVSGAKEVRKLLDIGDGDEEIKLNLHNVYGIIPEIE